MVGNADGFFVGEMEGLDEGVDVGWLVGIFVGGFVGFRVVEVGDTVVGDAVVGFLCNFAKFKQTHCMILYEIIL